MAFDRNGIRLAGAEQGKAAPDDALRGMLQTLIQETLEQEFAQFVGAERHERTTSRRGWRNGHRPAAFSHASARSRCASPAIAPGSFARSCSLGINGASKRS